ncbi:histidine kinase [Nocardia sp. CDC153]|uniref:sensor histidine kinase n=1 Tax=Nocardia sp. CDC153 TaxID=3112167 RepID=UPI002DB79AF8|nr:histidine kinase [Nocardia sp. CDC153]MEC3953265.1 histidine kinase [Nocardia sp. CDC153]
MKVIPARRHDRILDGVLGLTVLLVGAVEALISIRDNAFPHRGSVAPIVVLTALAVGCARWRPGLALALMWVCFGYQLYVGVPVLMFEVAFAAVIFVSARRGDAAAMAASAVSVPVAGVLAYAGLRASGAVLVLALFGVCWAAGLALRLFAEQAAHSLASQHAAEAEAARAHRESAQAREIARLREEQAQMARDVHDVVGHSLAVILAQAESAQFIADSDTAKLRGAMANIAKLARSSLGDVRQVLTSATPSETGPGELHELIEGVRASGHTIDLTETGVARTLAPELATVAYRVLQEMLTNAIRHSERGTAITVELHWADDLEIRTANAVAAEPKQTNQSGIGLEGMRRRLESVGGRLDVQRPPADAAGVFTVAARVPLRRVGS